MSKLDNVLKELPTEEATYVKPLIKALMLELVEDLRDNTELTGIEDKYAKGWNGSTAQLRQKVSDL